MQQQPQHKQRLLQVPHEDFGEDDDDDEESAAEDSHKPNDNSGCTTNGGIGNILEDSNDEDIDEDEVDEDEDDGYSKIKSLIERKQKK